jgi:muramidase (phage lysozyme)
VNIDMALRDLLAAIRKHEGGTYGRIYAGAKGVPKNTDVSKMTLRGVLDFQARMLDAGSASTACGGYQFLRKTLMATMAQMALNGTEVWTPELQDRMAVHLMVNRGLNKYRMGTMSRDDFANNLAKEWASLPVVTRIWNGKRWQSPGQSYYAGDGLNKSFHKVDEVLSLVSNLRAPITPLPTPDIVPTPETPPPAKRGLLLAIIEFIVSLFKRRT